MSVPVDELKKSLEAIGRRAVSASRALAVLAPEEKVKCLNMMADSIVSASEKIKEANAIDMANGEKNGLGSAMLDRLRLDDSRIAGMAQGLREVAAQDDPVGRELSCKVRPNGLVIRQVTVPLGVIAIIYESRPNVTADAAGICIKAGNAVILRGGSEAFHSNMVIADVLNQAMMACGLPDGAVQLLPWTDRTAVNLMLKMDKYIDLVMPRGGEGLIRAVTQESTIPVLKHYKGVCHLFVDRECDMDMAVRIVENAKCSRPGTCNTLETLLIDKNAAADFIPRFLKVMAERGVELRGDETFRKYAPEAGAATEDDYYAEYLDLILAVRVVDGVKEAVEHINTYGSKHSDGIISSIDGNVKYFFANVDSSTLYHNASTRFTDGGEFGMGAEIGISTDKLHARGPMGADQLTSTKFLVEGQGQIR